MIKKVGIIGLGMVGKNLYRYFKEAGLNVKGFDLNDSPNTLSDTVNQGVVFLCLPTLYIEGKKFYDLSSIKDTLPQIPNGTTVIIKSTVLPGTTDGLQEKHPGLDILFSPEFLTEKYAWEDTVHPDTSIVGHTPQSKHVSRAVLNILPEAQQEFLMTAKEAEYVKMARNNYFINKIVFMNMLYDVVSKDNCRYDKIKDALASDRRIRRSHMEIFHQGGRGGGGTCFTKDGPAWRDFVVSTGTLRARAFTLAYVDINKELLDETKKDTGKQYQG